MRIIDRVGEVLHSGYVEMGRTMAFITVHRQFPSLCEDLEFDQGEGYCACENCGWKVHFHENSVHVKEQVRQ